MHCFFTLQLSVLLRNSTIFLLSILYMWIFLSLKLLWPLFVVFWSLMILYAGVGLHFLHYAGFSVGLSIWRTHVMKNSLIRKKKHFSMLSLLFVSEICFWNVCYLFLDLLIWSLRVFVFVFVFYILFWEIFLTIF